MSDDHNMSSSEIDCRAIFLTKEFDMLRGEIDDSKERTFKIITGQVFALPIISILSEKITSEFYNYVFLIMPFVVLILVLTYVHEQYTVLRAGLYIKLNIEPILAKSANVDGWENWIEKKHYINSNTEPYNPREGDGYLRKGFWILSAIYYLFSVGLAIETVAKTSHMTWPMVSHQGLLNELYTVAAVIIILIYFVVGVYVFNLAFKRCPVSTESLACSA
jgi:hypothetical protein